ncbi:MAG: hypothetical protein JNK82_20410 [Myxococcaceae bacterium]|nr:hypothetical protein [Myxococcaceae bacterium]
MPALIAHTVEVAPQLAIVHDAALAVLATHAAVAAARLYVPVGVQS